MCHWNHRKLDPDHGADFARPLTGGIDNDLRPDVALIGHDPVDPAILELDRSDSGAGMESGAARLGSGGQRHREAGWIDETIARKVDCAFDPLEVH